MTSLEPLRVNGVDIPVDRCGVLVIGSGAASLAAADRLAAFAAAAAATTAATAAAAATAATAATAAATATAGRPTIASDIVIATESLLGGTSFNTGSDKQTYYRLSLADRAGDSAYGMAEALWEGGAVHGDIALAEAMGSVEAFCRLVSIGVPFPMNEHGGFVGYKTDHDPRKRGTSIGPYTSRVMVERLRAEVRSRGIPMLEGLHAVALIADPPETDGEGRVVANGRAFGALFLDESRLSGASFGLRVIVADSVVFGVGGPGGLYASSVYPEVHSGAIGLAIEAGVPCVNLTESQFGLASTGFRWNVSGTYQQAVPRYVSVGPEGGEEEFLTGFFPSAGARDSAVFLKGYQWPFDPRKVSGGGSSLIDLLVHRERAVRGRRVYMDFRRNPSGWDPAALSAEAREYLRRSDALGGTPLDRLVRMNPIAAEHYRKHGIDLSRELLEIAICAQHNNGGLAADAWWEAVGMDRFFPVGEVNGSHGLYRPGGAALNAGQVGALRAARRIVGAYGVSDLRDSDWRAAAASVSLRLLTFAQGALGGDSGSETLAAYRDEFRSRMDRCAGIIRPAAEVRRAASDALAQAGRFGAVRIQSKEILPDYFRCRHLALAHAAYLEAVASYAEAGGGSRGSCLVAGAGGEALHPSLDASWNAIAENKELRQFLQEVRYSDGSFRTRWEPRRPIPESDDWFEDVWRVFREGNIYKAKRSLG